jgi:hypothetical protein
MTPAIAPTSQMWWSTSSIRVKNYRHLCDSHPQESTFDDHLAGELHSRGLKIHLLVRRLREPSQSTMEVTNGAAKENFADPRQDRIPNPFVLPRHGSRFDAPSKPVAHHEIGPITQLCDKRRDGAKIITIVGITHDYVFAPSRLDSAPERITISLGFHVDDSGAQATGNLLRAIRTAVVGNYYLSINRVRLKRSMCFPNAAC